MENIRNNILLKLSLNLEYQVRLYVLRGINLARRDEDSESDPYMIIYTEK